MFAERGEINPPLAYASHWWVVVALCVLGAALLGYVLWRLRRPWVARPEIDVESVRVDALERIDALMRSATQGVRAGDAVAVAGRLSGEVRRFLGAVTGTDLDFSTSLQWRHAAVRDPRLSAPVQFLEDLEGVLFAPDAQVDLDVVHTRAVQVVTQWR